MRLDLHIVTLRNCPRNRAQFFIDQELVTVNGVLAKKPSQNISETDRVEILDDKRTDYVARSAVKLERYLASNPDITIAGKVCLDVGSSTGGFVQVLLASGASTVVGIDVGSNQLHETLRNNPKVISLESTDFREYEKDREFDIITTDVSFISLHHLLEAFTKTASPHTKLILLFKPQFEVGRENLTRAHLPKSEEVILEALARFREALVQHGLKELDFRESELPGESGNHEWVFLLQKNAV